MRGRAPATLSIKSPTTDQMVSICATQHSDVLSFIEQIVLIYHCHCVPGTRIKHSGSHFSTASRSFGAAASLNPGLMAHPGAVSGSGGMPRDLVFISPKPLQGRHSDSEDVHRIAERGGPPSSVPRDARDGSKTSNIPIAASH